MKYLILLLPLYAFAGQPGGYIAKPDSCSFLKKCSSEKSCEDPSDECFQLNACDEPVCLSEKQACVKECGTTKCQVMESFPAQVNCN
jgi:hypothetical protein